MKSSKERTEKIHRLFKFFDNQIETLQRLGCSEKVIGILSWQRSNVIGNCLRIRIPPNRIPFIPVITLVQYKLEELMAMVRYGELKGEVGDQAWKERCPIMDTVGSQPFLRPYFDPYYAINIEDGTLTKGMSVRQADKKIILAGRSPLTVAESISLCVHTDVLSRHYLWATGSRWESENQIPEISLTDFGNNPQLDHEFVDTDDYHEDLWGIPSCGRRVG